MKGVGYATTTVVFWLNIYYVVVLAWGAVYLVYCFTYIGHDLPWTTCNNAWNSLNCLAPNYTGIFNTTIGLSSDNDTSGEPDSQLNRHKHTDPATEFWE